MDLYEARDSDMDWCVEPHHQRNGMKAGVEFSTWQLS